MVDAYLRSLKSLLSDTAADLDLVISVACRHFFSGAAAYADGQIFMTLTPAGLALRLPEALCADLLADGAKPLKYFPKAPIKKHYVVLTEAQAADRKALAVLDHGKHTNPSQTAQGPLGAL